MELGTCKAVPVKPPDPQGPLPVDDFEGARFANAVAGATLSRMC